VCLLRLTQAFNVQKAGLDMLTPIYRQSTSEDPSICPAHI
jgi:hypothetical protein